MKIKVQLLLITILVLVSTHSWSLPSFIDSEGVYLGNTVEGYKLLITPEKAVEIARPILYQSYLKKKHGSIVPEQQFYSEFMWHVALVGKHYYVKKVQH